MLFKLHLTERVPPVYSENKFFAATLASIFSFPLFHTSTEQNPVTKTEYFHSIAKGFFHHFKKVSFFTSPVFEMKVPKMSLCLSGTLGGIRKE